MAFESRSFPRYHWVRRIRNRNIASELVKVQPFIYTACCLNIEPSSAVEALEEPFAIFCVPVAASGVTNVSQSIRTYDGSVFIRTILSENTDYDALRCRTRFRSHDSCFWFVRLLEYGVQYNESENEFVLMVQFLSIIHEFHLREPVFAAMPNIMTAFSHRRMNMAPLRRSPSSNAQSSRSSVIRVCESSCDGSPLLPDHALPGIFAVTSPSVTQTAVEPHPVRTEGNQIPDGFGNHLTPLTPVSAQQNDGGEVRSVYVDSGISVALLDKQFTPIHHSEESRGTLQFPDFGPPSDPAGFEPTQANCSPSSDLRLSQCVPNSTGVTDSTPLDLNSIVEGSQMPTDAISVSNVTTESCPTSSESSLFAGPSLNRKISPTGSLIVNASPLSSPVTLELPTANVDEPLCQPCVTAEPSVTSLKDSRSVEHSGISSLYKFFSGSAGSLVQRLCKVFMSADPAASGTGSKRLVDHSKESDCYIVSVSSPSRQSRLSRVSLGRLVHSLLHRIRDSVRSRCCRWKRARFIRKAMPSWTQSPRSGLLASFSNGWPSLSTSFSTPADKCEPCLSPGLVDLQPAQTTPSIRSLPPRFSTLLTYPTHDRSTLSDAETTLRRVVKDVAAVTRIKLCSTSTLTLQQLTESFH